MKWFVFYYHKSKLFNLYSLRIFPLNMNSTGWKILQVGSLVYYTRKDGMTSQELLTEEVIISRTAQDNDKRTLNRVEIAQKIKLSGINKSQFGSLLGIVVRRECRIQIGVNIMQILNIYVGNKEYDKDVLITNSTILEIVDLKTFEKMESAMQKLELTDQEDHSVVNQIKELIMYPLIYPRLIEKLGLDLSKGVLIHGPPGVGKTRMVLELVKSTRAELVSINGPEIFSPILGESEKALINSFQKASDASKQGPCILLIDEIVYILYVSNSKGCIGST